LSGFQKQFPPTNNQLRTSSNSRSHATVHDGQIVTKTIQRKALGNVGNTGYVSRQCKERKRVKDSQYFKDKMLLMEAKEKGAVLDVEAEAFLADVKCTAPYDQPLAIMTINIFEVSHEDAYDSDVNEGPHAASAFMANFSSTGGTNDTTIVQRNKRNAELEQENVLLKSNLSQKVESINSLKTESKKVLPERKDLEKSLDENLVKEVTEFMRIFEELDKEYEQCVFEKKKLQIEKKNPLIQNECLITDCIANDICFIVLASDRDRPLSEELSSNYEQLQGKDGTIRKLQTHINSMSMLNVEPTVGSLVKQAIETELTQLKDAITSVKIQNDGFKVENINLKRCYQELSTFNSHSRDTLTRKITALTTENAKLKSESLSKMHSEPIVPEKPKVLAPGMIVEPIVKPLELTPCVSSNSKVTMISRTALSKDETKLLWTMLIFTKPPLFLWAEALKAKADIGVFVGYAPTKKAYQIFNKRTRKIQETIHVTFDKLSEGMPSVHSSTGLEPNTMAPVHNGAGPKISFLQSGRTRSELVNDPTIPSVLPSAKQLEELFQPMFDDDEEFPPAIQKPSVRVNAAQAPKITTGSPYTTIITEKTPFPTCDNNVFEPYIASEASSSKTLNVEVTLNSPITHVQKWTKDHSLENVIGDLHSLVSTRQQLETDAMWCFCNEFLTHVEPKNYKQALEHYCWIEAIGIFINQSKFALEILKKYGFDNSTSIDTPIAKRLKLDEDKGGKLIDPTRFHRMVSSLMYLSASRPDIVFVVCLWYPKDSGFALKAFADSNYAGCQDTRRKILIACKSTDIWSREQQAYMNLVHYSYCNHRSSRNRRRPLLDDYKKGKKINDLQLIICGDMFKDSNSYLKSRGSFEDFVSFREMITSQLLYLRGSSYETLFVLSSSNRGRLLGFLI
nr:hypothetical protein [Tanacetum cinerariifolium]